MLTITEWAKLNPTPLTDGVVEIFTANNPVLQFLPFQNIAGNAFKYNREQTLPGVAFRDFGEGYTESTGVLNPITENLTILGGDSDFDVAQIKMGTGDTNTRAVHDAMKAKAATLVWLKTFFDGKTATNPKEFDGLNTRLTGAQLIAAGTNGAQLDLNMLDALVDAVVGTPTLLLMNKSMRRKIRALARGSLSLTVDRDMFGREVDSYQGVPIGIVEDDATGNAILGFDETQGSSNVTTSIYAVRFDPEVFHGIQTAPIDVRDLGEIEAKPAYRTRTEWYSGLALKHGKAAARLSGLLAPV